MNFIKGVIIGTAVSASAIMLYTETSKMNTKKMMKKGKKFMKSMGW